MRVTRIIACAVIGLSVGLTALDAQTLRDASPPAEFPPASYKGKQYVDSKGCIYIRAGVDGNVTWVPRVTRTRKHVCGYKPTAVAGATRAPTQQTQPTVITIEPSPAPAAPVASVRTPATPQPAPQAQPQTRPVTSSQTAPQAATTAEATKPTKPVAVAPAAQTAQQPTVVATPLPAAAPARKPVATNKEPEGVRLSLNTRVVQRHIYDRRQNTTNVKVPKGYRTVWKDDRLNPHRAERTLRPAIARGSFKAPPGYRAVHREDDRLNPKRGMRTAQGDARSDGIWTRTVPRTLVPVATSPQIIPVKHSERSLSNTADNPAVIRLSTRSAPNAQYSRENVKPAASGKRRYVRVATYESDADARKVAQKLATTGLPMRLGSLKRRGQTYRVVLAGPYSSDANAREALARVRRAGFGNAKLSKSR